ncbi:MAG: hypothetical protein EBR30_11700 [Cytophagia bacterium]|nr:hypothetical protein [Cytophagia bacterium]
MRTIVVLSNFILMASITFGQSVLNERLIKQLDSIRHDDQAYREQLESIQSRYGGDSKEMKDLWRIIAEKDSLNRTKVEIILNKYGWLGKDVIGEDGNTTLFLVIQHSNIATQEKYLPMIREAVKNGNAKASSLALLEDRIALRQGKRQIYGSQVAWNMITNEYYVLPLDDPDNVDKRRAKVGLQPLSDYLGNFNLKWDAEQYKKDLPSIEARQEVKKE